MIIIILIFNYVNRIKKLRVTNVRLNLKLKKKLSRKEELSIIMSILPKYVSGKDLNFIKSQIMLSGSGNRLCI